MFSEMSDEELSRHIAISQYGNLTLTDAVRPPPGAVLCEGYREGVHRDSNGYFMPILTVAATRDKLCDLFHELLLALPDTVDVHLDGSHETERITTQCREEIDLCVLRSILRDPLYENVLLNDGCATVAVTAPHIPLEVQFSEHKTFIIFAREQKAFRRALRRYDIPLLPDMYVIDDYHPHIHQSSNELEHSFEQLGQQLSVV